MKDGRVPIHIMRFAPADYLNEPAVKLALAEDNVDATAFYPLFLFAAFTQGGSLQADLRVLSATIGMPRKRVERALAFWRGTGTIEERDGRLYQKRLSREVAEELEFREEQSKRANKRWHKGSDATALPPQCPPLPAPTPIPAPIPAPTPSAGRQAIPNPLIDDRKAKELEALSLVNAIKAEDPTHPDGTEVLHRASEYRGRGLVNPASMPDDRLAHTLIALRAWLRELRGEPEPAGPPKRASPGATVGDRVVSETAKFVELAKGGQQR